LNGKGERETTKFGRTIIPAPGRPEAAQGLPKPARHTRVLQLSTIELIINDSDLFALNSSLFLPLAVIPIRRLTEKNLLFGVGEAYSSE